MADLPVILEYIRNCRFEKVVYIGHSMGSSIGFIYASLKNDHAEKYLKGIIAFCPITAMKKTRTPAKKFVNLLNGLMQNFFKRNLTVLLPDIFEFRESRVRFCSNYPGKRWCRVVSPELLGNIQNIPDVCIVF